MGSPSDAELHSTFNKIVKKSTKRNTYKFALARFLLERSREAKGGGALEVGYADVAESFFRYYWAHACKSKLHQGSTDSVPVV